MEEEKNTKKVENSFERLNAINVNDKTENKNGLTYLSWAWAWAIFKKEYPTATYEIKKFENNLPSNFLKMVTGKEPTTIAEKDFNINLTKHKTEVLDLFAKMSQEKDYSFVIMNGLKKFNNRRFHVYVIENVDMEKQELTIKNKRGNIVQTISFDEALKTFKSISGYFNKDLAQDK